METNIVTEKNPQSENVVLEVKNICKTYQAKNGEIEALKDINFNVNEGEYISIIGPSGCGKSTLLSIISGLETKTKGEITVKRKNWIYASKRQFIRVENNIKKCIIRIRNTKNKHRRKQKICYKSTKKVWTI